MGPSDKSTTLPLATTAMQLAPVAPVTSDVVMSLDTTNDDSDVSREALLQRAAELGPGPRLSLDNIMMTPTDPILAQKIMPRVAERRARFRTVVKLALGACAGFCLIATAATALSSSKAPSTKAGSTDSTIAQSAHTVPSEAEFPFQKLEVASTSKATPSTPAPAAAAAPRLARHKKR